MSVSTKYYKIKRKYKIFEIYNSTLLLVLVEGKSQNDILRLIFVIKKFLYFL